MSKDIKESTQIPVPPPGVLSNFHQDLLTIIEAAIHQFHSGHEDRIKALYDRMDKLEKYQGQREVKIEKLMEAYQNDVLKKSESRLEEFASENLAPITRLVQSLESQRNQPQQIKQDLVISMDGLRKDIENLLKITDRLVSGLNVIELRQEEQDQKLLTMSEIIRAEVSIRSTKATRKKGFFSWFQKHRG